AGNVVAADGRSVGVGFDIEPDPDVQANVIEPLSAAVARISSEVIGTSEVELDARKPMIRTVATNEGNLMADALRAAAANLAEDFGSPVPDVAIQNGGGIRNDSVIPPGDITVGTTWDIAPFRNFVVVGEVPREVFHVLLEQALDRLPGTGGQFAQVSGFTLSYDPSAPAREIARDGDCSLVGNPGGRVQEVVLDDGTVIVTGGQVVPGDPVVLATIDFLVGGGDCYPLTDIEFTKLGVSYQQALANYISRDLGGKITAEDYPVGGGGRIVALEPEPEPEPEPVPEPELEPLFETVTVKAGDTLRKIAMAYLGDENRWPEIYELNRGVVQADGRALTNPNLITIGWVLMIDVGAEPLPIDAATRVGKLGNGFTYYLRSNDRPGNSVTMRLVVNAGSANEPAPGLGIAHFVEHMMFRGTEAYSEDVFSATVRNLGAELGPDTNAYVWYDQAVYELTVAADEPEKVSTALHVLSQLAHAATISPEATESERGVVIDELRFRTATGRGQIGSEFDRIYTEGTPYEGYYAGGTLPSLESMTAEDLRAFYETWYVPSNLAIVAVGDMPVAKLHALVQEHFGPIPAGEPPPFSLPEVVPDPAPSYHVVTHEEQGFNFISLDIPIPASSPGTYEGQRLGLMERLIQLMVLNRLEDAYYRGELTQVDRPSFSTFTHGNALRYYGTNWQGDDLATASAAYMSVLLTIGEFGFTDADLSRASDQLVTALEHELESAATTTDPEYADSYLTHFLFGADISAPPNRHDRLIALLDEMQAEELTARYRWMMDRAGPLFIAVGPDPAGLPTTSDLEAAVSAAVPRSEPPPVEESIDELMQLPDPVEPVESGALDALKGFEWEFANGAKVMFVHSEIDEATVHIRARALGGWSQLEPGARALAPRAVEAVLGSGFGDLSKSQINRFLDESTASVSAVIGERVEGFNGASNTDDLETAFQLMHLLVTAPRVDDVAFGQAFNGARIRTQLAEVNPAWQAWVAYNEARFGLEWHRPVATHEQLAAISPKSLLDLYQSRLGDVDDLLVAVVGDVDTEVVERLARHYIGTLPAGEADTFVDRHRPFPEGVTRREIPEGPEASAVLEISHEAELPVTPSVRVNAHVLRVLLDERLLQQVREELGASYVVYSTISPTPIPRPTVYSDIVLTVDAEGLEDAHATVLSILADLVANGPTAEELQQASAVAAADYDKVTNSTLLNILTERLYTSDDNVLTLKGSVEALGEVTAATVKALATELYDTENRIEIVRLPTAPTEESS
ncbi:MAG: insulinase family protein, partial [bacterium]|nr:insulinase family protein [bacterium]